MLSDIIKHFCCMYARRRSIRRRPSRNSDRTSPPTTIANNCNPTVSRNIDFSYFRDTVLPVAIANKWLTTTAQVETIVHELHFPGPTEDNEDGWFELPPYCIGFTVILSATDGVIEVLIVNDQGKQCVVDVNSSQSYRKWYVIADLVGITITPEQINLNTQIDRGFFEEDAGNYLTQFRSNDIKMEDTLYAICLKTDSNIQIPQVNTLYVNPTKSSLIMPRVTSHI